MARFHHILPMFSMYTILMKDKNHAFADRQCSSGLEGGPRTRGESVTVETGDHPGKLRLLATR